jgi:spermidine/putrescine transport system ATP-binding protein
VADFVGTVNLFEGVLARDEPNEAEVRCSDLPAPVYLDHGVTGARGSTVWVALRPEKIEMHKRKEGDRPFKMEDAPDGANVVAGVIRDIVYLGSETNFEVEIEGGRRVKTFRSNLTRYDQEDFTWDEPVWLAWHACSPAVLLS